MAGHYGGAFAGAVGASLVCSLDCFEAGWAAGSAVGTAGGGIGIASLATIPARVRPGRVAGWTAVAAAAGGLTIVAGGLSDSAGLRAMGTAVVFVGMPVAAGAAAATDARGAGERAAWTVSPAVGRSGAGLRVVGRF